MISCKCGKITKYSALDRAAKKVGGSQGTRKNRPFKIAGYGGVGMSIFKDVLDRAKDTAAEVKDQAEAGVEELKDKAEAGVKELKDKIEETIDDVERQVKKERRRSKNRNDGAGSSR
jgi:hypothetical protein